MQIAGFFGALAAVLYSTVTSSSDSAAFSISSVQHDAVELPYRPDFFHAVFTLASTYLVRWGCSSRSAQHLHVAHCMSACEKKRAA